jgi:hypothetical protein
LAGKEQEMAKAKSKRRAPSARQLAPKSSEPRTKLDLIVEALRAPNGASIQLLIKRTGWQPHSLRGVMAGALKSRGLKISSSKVDGERIYRIVSAK